MKKAILIFFALFLFVFPKSSFAADNNFDISVNTNYTVAEEGITTLTQNISIKNKSEYIYTPSYSISIGLKDIENIQVYNSDGSIPFTITDEKNGEKNIRINFTKRYTGVGTINNFALKFQTKDITKRRGNLWEVSIPGIADSTDFTSYNVSVTVPQSFGNASIIKPIKNVAKTNFLQFNKDEVDKAGVFIIYGDFQYYKYTVRYNISNPNLYPVKTEIALPPSTNYQESLIKDINPKPSQVRVDTDGNWIAEYHLLPQQKQTVVVKGVIRISAQPSFSSLTDSQIKSYLQPKEYWQANDPEIIKLAKTLRTPEKIYDYVVSTLTYDYNKVTSQNTRLGGKGVLLNSKSAVCLEFSDLFVTLSRAAGIPARAIEGFAYTDNDKLRPLSLVEDVLHAWPEYYDLTSKRWIMVDPTWGNTTKGIDYFSSLDFEHIAFVVKGIDSTYPIPAGGYKFEGQSKDVDISFADPTDFSQNDSFEISDTFPQYSFFNFPLKGNVTIRNTGESAIQDKYLYISTNFTSSKREFYIDYIPPYGSKSTLITYDKLPFLTNKDYELTISFGNENFTKNIKPFFIPDFKFLLVGGGILFGAAITFIITFKTWSILIQRRKRQNTLRGKGKRP